MQEWLNCGSWAACGFSWVSVRLETDRKVYSAPKPSFLLLTRDWTMAHVCEYWRDRDKLSLRWHSRVWTRTLNCPSRVSGSFHLHRESINPFASSAMPLSRTKRQKALWHHHGTNHWTFSEQYPTSSKPRKARCRSVRCWAPSNAKEQEVVDGSVFLRNCRYWRLVSGTNYR